MTNRSKLFASTMLVASALAAGWSTSAFAQDRTHPGTVEEVVVTGSFIQGTPKNTALPVEVISAEELQKKGQPTPVEMIKSLTVSHGVLGEANQFTPGRGQAGEGAGSVNLRGLGPERTLVLVNGHRMATGDTNAIPQSAIGRVEVLKDGAAATYGSDAIAGVVNFITRRHFTGLEVSANYRSIDGSNGDYGFSAVGGYEGERFNVLVAADYRYKSDLSTKDRDWALRPYYENPQGGWSSTTNIVRFTPVAANFSSLGAARLSPGCVELGGILTGDGLCRTANTAYDNIVDETRFYQLYGELNYEIAPKTDLHFEAMWANTIVPTGNTSPAFGTSRGPTVAVLPAGFPSSLIQTTTQPATSNVFYVPIANPGFAALCAATPSLCPTGTSAALISVSGYRPFGLGGNPYFGGDTSYLRRERTNVRVMGELKGSFAAPTLLGTVNWKASLGYSQYDAERYGFDVITGRLELAMRGLGGPNCARTATSVPGQSGCLWFNPFPNNISGQPGFVANSAEVISWLYAKADDTTTTSSLWEGNLVFNGVSAIELPGGNVGWAIGGQWRRDGVKRAPEDASNAVLTSCSDSLTTGNNTCFPATSPYISLGQITPTDLDRDVYAGFVEISLPFFDRLNASIAARYEDYGKNGGKTFNPQVRGKFQALKWIAFRGSLGTTFRAPPQEQLIPDPVTNIQTVLNLGGKPVDTRGNPNLKPEKAVTYNVGAIIEAGQFRATIDYYNFEVKDLLTTESLNTVLATTFPAGQPDRCADTGFVQEHFTFSGPCAATNITSVRRLRINAGKFETSGVDLMASYVWRDVLGGDLELGGTAGRVIHYSVNEQDLVGLANFGNSVAYPVPKWKAELYANYSTGPHNLRATMRYIDSYADSRDANTFSTAITPALTQVSPVPTGDTTALLTNGRKIKAQVQLDLAYNVRLPRDTTASVQIQNVTDEDPSFARTELNYDPLTGNPLGRTIQLSVRKRF